MIRYKTSTDIALGHVDIGLLSTEISNGNCVSNFVGITNFGDCIEVWGEVTNQVALDAIVSAHNAHPLTSYRLTKNASIDRRTQELIANGFAFDGKGFSLSSVAQMNWSGLKTFESILTWPVKLTANGDQEYELSQANLIQFVSTALGTVSYHYTTGRALKLQVNAAQTNAEIDAVVDSR